MTLVPTRVGVVLTEVKDRPDLGEYELGAYCMVPGCDNFREDGGGHHVWRRSNQTKSWWVELPDGTLAPNRVGLCFQHHRDVTGEIGGHKARIDLSPFGYLVWLDNVALVTGEGAKHLQFAYDPFSYLPEALQLTVDGEEKPHQQVVGGTHDHEAVKPGEKCPTCKRRVNHPKTESSPSSKVFGMRVPLDEVTAHEELTEAVAEHLGIETSEKYWKFKVDAVAKALVLQTSKSDLAKLLAGRGG